MKIQIVRRSSVALVLLALLSTLNPQLSTCFAQGAAFTYQGRLNDGPKAAVGSYDLRFAIYDSSNNPGALIAGPATNSSVAVSNGLFAVTLDFGTGVFTGADRWLQIDARSNGAGEFAPLIPRQKLTAAPYAIFAEQATTLANGAALGMGTNNVITAESENSFIGGGRLNQIAGSLATISGGYMNSSLANWSFIGGGAGNTNTATYSAIAGGAVNHVDGFYGFIGAGYGNTASGTDSTVPGGLLNVANGFGSFAAGNRAQALHDGTFVWADSQGIPFASTAPDQFLIRAAGGVGVGTTNPVAPLQVANRNGAGESLVLGVDPHAGGYTALSLGLSAAKDGYAWLQAIKDSGTNFGNLVLNPSSGNVGIGAAAPAALLQVGSATCNGTTWQNASDRALKENIQPVDADALLRKVAALPISQWRYRKEPGAAHIGPMAQDFHALFGLNGADAKHIATVDEGGVALAAIQGLNQKLTAELEQKQTEITELKQRLAKIELLLKPKLNGGAE